jgi:glycosyltransferase involved in cell wall biosynthesis/predicted O-methyltransferase YrrM
MADDMRQPAAERFVPELDLPENDYVSPGLVRIMPDAAFPNLMIGDTSRITWPYLRRWVEHNWYTDRLHPHAGFINRDEAAILYNTGLMFAGKNCLEVGCWRGWSAVHLALATGALDVIDPILAEPEFLDTVTQSLRAAGVYDKVRLVTGSSPAAMDRLAAQGAKEWSLIFIDGDHEGEAPRLDAQAAMRHAAPDAIVLFHDLASPFVAAGLDAMRNAGWSTMIYQTMQIMGVAWRGDVEPVAHTPDPTIFWTLPAHLAGYQVSGWRRRRPSGRGVTLQDKRDAAMLRAQAAEDEAEQWRAALRTVQAGHEQALSALTSERDALKSGYESAVAQVAAATARLQADAEILTQIKAQLDLAWTERAEAAGRAEIANAKLVSAEMALDEERRRHAEEIARLDGLRHSEAAKLHEAEAGYAASCAGWETTVAALRAELAAAQTGYDETLAGLRSELATAQSAYEILRAGHQKAELSWQEANESYQRIIATLEKQANDAAAAEPWLRAELATGAARLAQAQAELAATQASHDDAMVKLADADRALQQLRARSNEAALAHEAALQEQQAQLRRLTAQRQEDQDAADALAEACAKWEAEHAAQRAANEELRQNLARQHTAWQHSLALLALVDWACRRRVLLGLLRRGQSQAEAAIAAEAFRLGATPHIAPGFTAWLSRRRTLAGLLRRPHDAVRALLLERLCPPRPGALDLPCQLLALAAPVKMPVLTAIWRHQRGSETAPILPDHLLRRHFSGLGFTESEAEAWSRTLRGEAAMIDETAALPPQLLEAADQIRGSQIFDAGFYQDLAGLPETIDPALHYALLGEILGLAPCAGFDPAYYLTRNEDIAAASLNALLHYQAHGRHEGRAPRAPATGRVGGAAYRPDQPNLLLVVHETSRTGAPILGWNIARHLAARYNLFIVSLGDGKLTEEFAALAVEIHGPYLGGQGHAVDIAFSLAPLFGRHRFAYAIVNSIESRRMLEICARHFIPSLLLMHEFGSTVFPAQALQHAFDYATEIVFSAPVIARSSIAVCPSLASRHLHIAPQGMSLIPASNTPGRPPADAVLQELAALRKAGGIVVLGAGSVNLRKGVDLFLATAALVQAQNSGAKIQFVWVGDGYKPATDMGYSIYLQEQLHRSGLSTAVMFLDEVSDLEPLYALTDLFYLSSRLDPLPNVTIDTACRGIPIICFAQASGMADILAAAPQTAAGVVDYLNTSAAAEVILRLAGDEGARQTLAAAMRNLGAKMFDMAAYVETLDRLGTAISWLGAQWRADAALLAATVELDQTALLGPDWLVMSRADAAATYVAGCAAIARDASAAARLPRPAALPGFDAAAWAQEHPETEAAGANALADYLRAGQRKRLAA